MYRSQNCAFCVNASEAICGRCQQAVCTDHQSAQRWCATCECERVEALEIAEMSAQLAGPGVVDASNTQWQPSEIQIAANSMNFLAILIRFFGRQFRVRRARAASEREFMQRTQQEIQHWQRCKGLIR